MAANLLGNIQALGGAPESLGIFILDSQHFSNSRLRELYLQWCVRLHFREVEEEGVRGSMLYPHLILYPKHLGLDFKL